MSLPGFLLFFTGSSAALGQPPGALPVLSPPGSGKATLRPVLLSATRFTYMFSLTLSKYSMKCFVLFFNIVPGTQMGSWGLQWLSGPRPQPSFGGGAESPPAPQSLSPLRTPGEVRGWLCGNRPTGDGFRDLSWVSLQAKEKFRDFEVTGK